MNPYTRESLAQAVAHHFNVPLAQGRGVAGFVVDELVRAVGSGARVNLRPLGVFELATRAPRRARDPVSGAVRSYPARRAVVFRPGKPMRRSLESLS